MQKLPDSSTELRFSRLTSLLAEWQPLWRPAPFMHRRLPWGEAYRELAERLLGLDDRQVARLQADPWQDSPLRDWLPVEELAERVRLAPLAAGDVSLPPAWGQHVSGRKWQQVEAFARHLRLSPQDRLLDWCAGKGHLARALARRHDVAVTALEWQATLCQEGRRLATIQRASVHMQQQDVMAAEAGRHFSPRTHVVALHACGDLHLRLLELAAAAGSSVSLAPCCYHRTREETYRPVSQRGRALSRDDALRLTRDDLALAVQETVTAPRGVRRRREQASAWRLGFDELQRELRGDDRYLPVPSLAYGRFPERFDDFCRWAAAQKGLTLPASLDPAPFERAGWQRQAEVKRLELVRHLFRRPLEIWLILDRLSLMEEAGYTVRIGTFCSPDLTPRNLLIFARKA
ncbi:methyltransferase [Halomonas sp. MCCC 1A17488]|uniref:methyltransferase n=1 Tax=unclassified Halomonas TaxID=2609666 RepID=UPI0018D248EB|nr:MULTISPECIES: methyltransferase [unclassified Halomonas]MCE8015568.1 methyltransferase [Halomonas sp. MCCC 1A17488]MCG3238901.1 methyltransferase [Halomonas sp. MCCC 1A17488]QPP51142.1 methyltransferase [Halomonas sp. SS10-MC5]